MSFLKRIIKKRDGAAGEDGAGAKSGQLPVGSGSGAVTAASGAAVTAMSADLQRKFARGVQFNMKIVIRGDKNVGKTALFYRLQGLPFKEEYIPTDEIQVASIHWNYKATDDIVKVEVWDVVDKGRRKKNADSLKLDHDGAANDSEPCLDASFVDVYKGTHAVIFVFDMTKQWTFKYIERELLLVPAHIPIIILANHRDMGEHRTVDPDTVRYFLAGLERGADAGLAYYAEASMLNGFGLKYLHKFINIPYLKLQKDTIVKQLELNTVETQAMHAELIALEESEEQNYNMFVTYREQRRKEAMEVAEQRKDGVPVQATVAARPAAQQQQQGSPASARAAAAAETPRSAERPQTADNPRREDAAVSAAVASSAASLPAKSSGFMSRLFSKKSAQDVVNQTADDALSPAVTGASVKSSAPASKVLHVDDFVPTEDVESALDFLEDAAQPSSAAKRSGAQESSKRKASGASAAPLPSSGNKLQSAAARQHANVSSDSDDDESTFRTNPMVAGFQDDLDSSDNDNVTAAPLSSRPLASANVDLSSDDENGPQVVLQPSAGASNRAASGRNQTIAAASVALPALGRLTMSSASSLDAEDPSVPADTHTRASIGIPSVAAAVTPGGAGKGRQAPSSGDDDEDDSAGAHRVVVLADEDVDDFPTVAAPKAGGAVHVQEQAIIMTTADLDFLDSISSSAKAPGAENTRDARKVVKKKKKSGHESSEKDGSTKKASSKKHKSRSSDGSSAIQSAEPVQSSRSAATSAAATAAKESRRHTPKKTSGGIGEPAAAGPAAVIRSEADALEAFLSG